MYDQTSHVFGRVGKINELVHFVKKVIKLFFKAISVYFLFKYALYVYYALKAHFFS